MRAALGPSESVDPSKEYLVRLMARDSTGNETLSEFPLRGERVHAAAEKRAGLFSTGAVLAGVAALAAGVIGWHRVCRRRHAGN